MKHLLSFLLAAFAVPALAGETVALTPPNLADVDSLEEIIISGDRDSLSGARKAMVEAEERLYARFNELNKDDAFDIVCSEYAPTGTLLRRRVCEPRGLERWTSAEAQSILFSTEGTVTPNASASMKPVFVAESKKRMLDLIRKDPQLLRALLERARLEKHYEEIRKEKFKEHWIVWD
jgi:hypothetical protein